MDRFELRVHKELIDEGSEKLQHALAAALDALERVADEQAARFWIREAINWHRHVGDSLYALRAKSTRS